MSVMMQQKKVEIAKLEKMALESTSVIAADFKGIRSNDMNELRTKLRALNICELKVVKNTLARKAFVGTSYENIVKKIKGPLIIAFIKDEPSLVAKLFLSFAKEKEKLAITGLLVEGKLLDNCNLAIVASLPTKKEALTALVTVIQGSILNLVRVINEPVAKLTRTMFAVSKVK